MDEERRNDQENSVTGEDSGYVLNTEEQDGAVSLKDMAAESLTAAMHSGFGIASPFTREIFLAKQAIVGMRFQGGSDDLVEDLKPGSLIRFMREPDNRFDKRAIMALDEQGRKLGYIPRLNNTILSALMDAGKTLYGIATEEGPEEQAGYGRNTPTVLYVDLYLREFATPDDMTQIPRQGYRGSYAVMDIVLADDQDASKIESAFVIKVINGEERGFFSRSTADTEDAKQDYEELIHELQEYIGYLPVVGYHIYGKKQEALENAWGVCIGRPFSNQVIDIRDMAWNRFQNNWEQSLDGLADRLGITVECDTLEEKRCRQILQIYCRLDRSELDRKPDTVSGTLTKKKYRTDLETPVSDVRMSQHLREVLEEKGIDILWEASVLKRDTAYEAVGEACITELEELLNDAGSGFMPEDYCDPLYGYPEAVKKIAQEHGEFWNYLLFFEEYDFRYRQYQMLRKKKTDLWQHESEYPMLREYSDFYLYFTSKMNTLVDILKNWDAVLARLNDSFACTDTDEIISGITAAAEDMINEYKRLMAYSRSFQGITSDEKFRDILTDIAGMGEQLCEGIFDNLHRKCIAAKKTMIDCIVGKIRQEEMEIDLEIKLDVDFGDIKRKVGDVALKCAKESNSEISAEDEDN